MVSDFSSDTKKDTQATISTYMSDIDLKNIKYLIFKVSKVYLSPGLKIGRS